jgi:hypothetical protein
MPSASESAGQQSGMRAALEAGLEQLSIEQTVTFQLYQKFVFTEDGFVFWVATQQFQTVKGSLHIATDFEQREDETVAQNTVILSAEGPIAAFNAIAPNTMWVGSWALSAQQNLQIAFSHRANYYQQANIFHYHGIAVLPAMSTQLVQSQADLPAGPIVSNSLPIWISQNTFQSGTTLLSLPVVPSWGVPQNIVPPYVVVHIEPGSTDNFGNFPVEQWPGTIIPNSGLSPLYELAISQLCRDEVDFIVYGLTNEVCWQYMMSLIAYSRVGPGEQPTFGFGNTPTPKDAKRTQAEIAALAMKKTFHISANYYQGTADAIAYRLILKALDPTITLVPV